MNKFYLGIDGGGTHTSMTLIDADRNIVAAVEGGGINVHSIGPAAARENLSAAAAKLLRESGVGKDSIAALCLGAAGMGRGADRREWSAVFSKLGFTCPTFLVTDSEAALVGGLHKREGLVVIAGTGSICVGFDAHGTFARAGGWGHIMGDEGSGYFIGTLILKAVTKIHDGSADVEGPTLLADLLLKRFNIAKVEELVPIIYGYKDKKDVASIASLIHEAVERGDKVAKQIAHEAANSLTLLAEAVSRRLCFEGGFDLTTGGSVLDKNPYIRQYFSDCVAERLPMARLQNPLSPPAFGAALIALTRSE